MGDNVPAAVGHLILAVVSGDGARTNLGTNYTIPGMHTNYFIHGILGVIHYSKQLFGLDIADIFKFSDMAARVLPLPCLMADKWRSEGEHIGLLHLLSGLVPFALAVSGQENLPLEHVVTVGNLVSLLYWSIKNDKEYGYFTAGAAAFAYFAVRNGVGPDHIAYPIGLAAVDYFASRSYV